MHHDLKTMAKCYSEYKSRTKRLCDKATSANDSSRFLNNAGNAPNNHSSVERTFSGILDKKQTAISNSCGKYAPGRLMNRFLSEPNA